VHSATPLAAAHRLFQLGKDAGGIPAMDIASCMEVVVHMVKDDVRGRHVSTIERIIEREGALMSEAI
jgi:Flp pilus assembly CpaF family ATPase